MSIAALLAGLPDDTPLSVTLGGSGAAQMLRLLPDATVLSRRALQKIRSGEKGWRYAAGQLEAWGADRLQEGADRGGRMEWLRRWVAELTRPLAHPGNYRYAWGLSRAVRLPAGDRYPKARAA